MRSLKLAGLLCLAGLLYAGTRPACSQNYKRICVIGSSSAVGYFGDPAAFPKDSGWVFKIKKYFKDAGIIDTLFNIAQSTTDCFTGMPSSYIPPAGLGYGLPNPLLNITRAINLVPRPDVIIVNYPSNNYDWIPNWQIISCLQAIKDSANANNIQCYITTSQPRNGFSPSERQKLKDLRALIMNTFGLWAIDFYNDIVQEPGLFILPEYSLGDGVHLNPAGHTLLKNRVLARNIFATLVDVKLSALNAILKNDQVLLSWQTLEEQDNGQFIIEKSTNGTDFQKAGAVRGNMHSTVFHAYGFTDSFPKPGNDYYRVVAVNTHGQKQYSDVARIVYNTPSLSFKSAVYPTRTAGPLSLQLEKMYGREAIVTITSAEGRSLKTEKIKPGNNAIHQLDISTYPAGAYIIIVQCDGSTQSHRVIKQ